jgi:methylmalonyl-CoA/ethylmalonyl-CoA epimerase
MLNRIGQIAIVATNVERATTFYRDTLGMTFLFSAPPRLAFFDCGGVRLMISEAEESSPTVGTSVIYYLVPDIHAARDALAARGAHFEEAPHLIAAMPTHDLWMSSLRDSEGNLLALMSEVARATHSG